MKGGFKHIAALLAGLLALAVLSSNVQRSALGAKRAGNTRFAEWMATHKKRYTTPAELQYREQVFESSRQIIDGHNRQKEVTYTMGLNYFSDLTLEEFRAGIGKGGIVSSAKDLAAKIPEGMLGDIVVPDSVDWSKAPVIGKVYDVDQCKSGYAFAAIQVLESAKYLETRDSERLSPENIVDCSSEVPYTNSGCEGGCVFMSLRYIKEQGVATEAGYPYTAGASGSSSFCQAQIARPYRISNYYSIPNSRSDILKNLVAIKPVVVTVDPKALSPYYTGGIFDGAGCSTSPETYFLMLVGYGQDKTVKDKEKSRYWILKNHISEKWGMGGYMKIIRSEGPVPGVCGITDNGVYVQL